MYNQDNHFQELLYLFLQLIFLGLVKKCFLGKSISG